MIADGGKLSNADMNDLGTTSPRRSRRRRQHKIGADNAADGRRLAEKFNCVACHGAAAASASSTSRASPGSSTIPAHAASGFKAQTRFDMDGNMTSAAQALRPEDIDVLADLPQHAALKRDPRAGVPRQRMKAICWPHD